MSSKKPPKKSLKLLEKLVQDNHSGEGAEEREALLDSLIKENGGNQFYEKMNGSYTRKTKAGKDAENERQSRSRTKDQHQKVIYARKPPSGQGSVAIPLANGKQRRSRSGSPSSTSSFWSSGSRSRSRSHSASPKRGSPERTPRRKTSSRSNSRSRSRSRSRSSSPHSTARSDPTRLNLKNISKSQDTMSEQGQRAGGKNQKGRKTKLLNRSPIRKFRSMDINPDVFIEERLNQKYQELHELVQTSFGDRRPQVTREYFNQIQSLRDSYTRVSHGLPPSGILLPGTGMLGDIKPPGVPQRRRPMSASTHAEIQDLVSEDGTYYTIQSVMTATAAKQQQKIRTDIHGEKVRKPRRGRRSEKGRKDSESTTDSTAHHNGYHDNTSSTLTPNSSKTADSPRSKVPCEPTDHHVKNSNKPELLSWLKRKDAYHRKQKRNERQKKKEERQKLVLEANDKFERKLESQKHVDKWIKEKKMENRRHNREEKERMKSTQKIYQENVSFLTVPGKPLRPQSAPTKKGEKEEGAEITPQEARLREDEQKQTTAMVAGPHPPASKFIYKRPVAGRIKLAMKERPKSASVITPQRNQSVSPRRPSGRDSSSEDKPRMSYEDWLQQKRKHEQKQKKELQHQKEELAKSDPELAKIVPEIAKKRIHRVLEGKKSIDTGIKDFDRKASNSFGGADFHKDEVNGDEEDRSPRPSYRLDSDRTSESSPRNVPKSLNLSGQSINIDSRPGTGAPRGRVPTPKQSSNSPRKVIPPPKDNRSDEVSAGFSLPFQEKDGVPAHVASMQRKIFAENVWDKLEDEERPEPQGCAATDSPQHLPRLSPSAKGENSVQGDNSVKNEDSSTTDNGKRTKDEKDTPVEETGVNDEEKVGNFFLTTREDILDDVNNGNDSVQSEKSVDAPVEEEQKFDAWRMTEDGNESTADRSGVWEAEEVTMETDSSNLSNKDQVETDKSPVTDDQEASSGRVSNDMDLGLDVEDLRPESTNTSRSSKRVSFREEAEILGKDEPEEDVDWSTDTATPDNDDYARMADEDLGGDDQIHSPDGEIPSQMSRTSLANSMDDDF